MLLSDVHLRSHRVRNALYRAEIAWGGLKKAVVPAQKLIFTVTNGRSGSERLTYLFSQLHRVDATHEPDPRFDTLMHEASKDPELARKFLQYVKLPAIAKRAKPIYVETSHMFGKGYFEAMLGLGLPFSFINLQRDKRKTALSMLRLDTVPGRTKLGRQFYLLPSEAKFVRLPDHAQLSDYQLCYWHVLETAARQRAYSELARAAGLTTVELNTESLSESRVLSEALSELEIEFSADERSALEASLSVSRNAREHQVPDHARIPHDLEAEERGLLQLVTAASL